MPLSWIEIKHRAIDSFEEPVRKLSAPLLP